MQADVEVTKRELKF